MSPRIMTSGPHEGVDWRRTVDASGLTQRQRQVRDFIVFYRLNHAHQSPTMQEVADELGVSLTCAWYFLNVLRRKGVVEWSPGRRRTLLVVG